MHSVIMFRRYVVRSRNKRHNLFSVGLILILTLLCGVLVAGQATGGPPILYLLAGTPTQHGDATFPLDLYRLNAGGKLTLVREVVTQSDGVRSVQAWGNAIFAIHPYLPATTVSIIHTDDPLRADDVVFSPVGVFPHNIALATPVRQAPYVHELIPWITDLSDPTHLKGLLASVTSGQAEAGSRVKFDTWDDFAALRREGETGGPVLSGDLVGSAVGDDLAISMLGHSIVIDRLPPSLRGLNKKIVPVIAAASQEYLLLLVQRTREEVISGKLGDSRQLFVHDRARNRWTTIQIEGNSSRLRLLGPWLATIVGMWNPEHKPSPGRDNERHPGSDRLPDVQTLYASFEARLYWLPGILVLQNLADSRKIRIETGQEDSEILWVGAETVIYRVNYTIFQARIVGDQIQGSSIVVKDENVPEVHWVFWAK